MTKTLTEQLEEWKALAEYDIPDYVFEDVRMMLLAAEQRGREEERRELQRDVQSILAMLDGDTPREKIANYIREYLVDNQDKA